MRFKLTLNVNKNAFGNRLPINYQYEQSAVIYRILASGNEQFAMWLHENGYQLESGKRFKLFTYSPFKVEKRRIVNDRLILLSDTIEWQISFLPEKTTEQSVLGLFASQTFEVGDKKNVVQFHVQRVELLPSPVFSEEMVFSAMSPLCIRNKNGDGSMTYLSPCDQRAKGIILEGLLSRYEAFYSKPYSGVLDFDLKVLNEPKRKLILIKSGTPEQTQVAGYLCQFRMKAPLDLMRIAYESGVGSGNSQGFGCVKEIR